MDVHEIRNRSFRWLAVVACSALAVAACGGGDDGRTATPRATATATESTVDRPSASSSADSDATGAADTSAPASAAPLTTELVDVDLIAPSPPDVRQSGLAVLRSELVSNLPEPLVELSAIRSGGPPPDGIPSIDEPRFVTAASVDFLGETEPVLAIDIDGDVRAYPVQILMWHEIVNDTVAGIPVAVTYCPLCNSAVAYDRRIDGRVLEFGTSGSLWNSALVMYDRQTETLWSHFTGQAIIGELTGTELERFPVATVPWGVWRDANPDGIVLSRETGFDRDYGRNPYPGYDSVDSEPFLFEGEVDGRYTAMTRIVGIDHDGDALGVPLVGLHDVRVVEATIGDRPVVVLWQPGSASALDSRDVAGGADIGATGVFLPVVDGRTLAFEFDGTDIVDTTTGSTWDVLGRATGGPLDGAQLEAIPHVDTFWFAWSTFRPDTDVAL